MAAVVCRRNNCPPQVLQQEAENVHGPTFKPYCDAGPTEGFLLKTPAAMLYAVLLYRVEGCIEARIRSRSRIYVLTNPTFFICGDAHLRLIVHMWCDIY